MTTRERQVAEALAALMAVELSQLSLTKTFEEQGADSLAALRLAHSLENVTGRHIALARIFEHPSIQSLAQFLDAEFRNPKGGQAASG